MKLHLSNLIIKNLHYRPTKVSFLRNYCCPAKPRKHNFQSEVIVTQASDWKFLSQAPLGEQGEPRRTVCGVLCLGLAQTYIFFSVDESGTIEVA